MALTLKILSHALTVAHFPPSAAVPTWALESAFFSVTRTDRELSVFCIAENVPQDVEQESGWRAFRVEGQLDFELTGVVSALSFALAAQQISIFSISTYETDYILVPQERLGDAVSALKRAGHLFAD